MDYNWFVHFPMLSRTVGIRMCGLLILLLLLLLLCLLLLQGSSGTASEGEG